MLLFAFGILTFPFQMADFKNKVIYKKNRGLSVDSFGMGVFLSQEFKYKKRSCGKLKNINVFKVQTIFI